MRIKSRNSRPVTIFRLITVYTSTQSLFSHLSTPLPKQSPCGILRPFRRFDIESVPPPQLPCPNRRLKTYRPPYRLSQHNTWAYEQGVRDVYDSLAPPFVLPKFGGPFRSRQAEAEYRADAAILLAEVEAAMLLCGMPALVPIQWNDIDIPLEEHT